MNNPNWYRVTVDYVDRYEMVIDGKDAQETMLKVENGNAHPSTNPAAILVAKLINFVHIKPVTAMVKP